VLGPDHPATLTVHANLALWTGAAGDAEAALTLYTALLPLFTRVFGGEHPATLSVRANLARWTGNTGEPYKALDMYRELRPTVERVHGARHPGTLVLRANIALWIGGCGNPLEACRLFAELLPERLAVSSTDHPSTLVVRANAAFWAIEAGQSVPAAEQTELMQALRRVLGDSHPTTVTLQAQLHGATVDRQHRYNALIPIVERITGAEHPRTMALEASPVTELLGVRADAHTPACALPAQAQTLDQRAVALDIVVAQIVEQPPTSAVEHLQSPTAVMIQRMGVQMRGDVGDPVGQQRDLHLRRTGVAGEGRVLIDDCFLAGGFKRHDLP
jgi:hypothetical protein